MGRHFYTDMSTYRKRATLIFSIISPQQYSETLSLEILCSTSHRMNRPAAEDAPPQLLQLFDCFWFEQTVLRHGKNSKEQSLPEPEKVFDEVHEQLFQKSELLRVPSTLHVRSLSDHALGVDLLEVPSPASVLAGAKLETILSGKEVSELEVEHESVAKMDDQSQSLPTKQQRGNDKHKWRRKKHGSSKSLSELEFEEVKGFMDLGFVFSEQDKDSADLVSIIPGLQRLGKNGEREEETKVSDKSSVPRPYLSEAWEILDRRRAADPPLVKWRVPDLSNEVAVKDQLKFWAHAVASTVR